MGGDGERRESEVATVFESEGRIGCGGLGETALPKGLKLYDGFHGQVGSAEDAV